MAHYPQVYFIFLFGKYFITIYLFVEVPCELIFRRTFQSSVTFGSRPQSVATADLNNDNQVDIVVLQIGANAFGILFSNSTNGTFSELQIYSTRSNSLPSSIAIADLNGDTYKDLIISKYGANSLTIYSNNQGKTFAEKKNISLGTSRPVFVRTSDLNNDNQTDIVVVNDGTYTIGVLLSQGNFSFKNIDLYSTGYDSKPVALAIDDLNKDTFMDIVVCNLGTDNIGIFYGKGDGRFENQIIYSTEHQSQPTSVVIVDFNDDTYLDIIVSNNGTNNLGIFLNNRNGSFQSQIKYSYLTPTYTQSLTSGDMNNDNYADILLVDQINNQFHVLLGTGNGSIFLQTTYDGVDKSEPYAIAVDKFNDNNRLDVVVTNFGTNEIVVFEDYSHNVSMRGKYYLDGTATYTGSFLLDDFNGDDLVDIVSYTNKDLFILFGQSDGTFKNKRLFNIGDQSSVQSLVHADLNNDNKSDIVITDIYSDRIIIFLGDGNGNFNQFQSYSTGENSDPCSLVIKDINKDKQLDLIVVTKATSTIIVFFGFGNGNFMAQDAFSIGDNLSPVVIVVEDFNNDTNEDLIVLLSYGHFMIFLGNGDGTFNYFTAYQIHYDGGSTSMTVSDYNSDGYLDLFITDPLYNLIRVYAGRADATFNYTITFTPGAQTQPYSMYITDMNGDQYVDLVISLYRLDTIVVYFGNQRGTFGSPKGYSTGTGTQPFGISVYDLKHDGKLEIIVALIGQGSILVFSEYSTAAFDNEIHYSMDSPPQPYSANVADFNGNNQIDIVVGNTGLDQLEILFDFYMNTNENKLIYSLDTNAFPRHVITCDFNNDGHTDIINVNTNLNSISLIEGYGDGTFGEQVKYSTGTKSSPYFIASQDLNNDSRIDLVIANEGGDNIGIYYGFNFNSFQDQMIYQPADPHSNPMAVALSYFNDDQYLDIVTALPDTATLGILFGNGDGTFSEMITCFSFESTVSPWGIATNDLNNDSHADLVVGDTALNMIYILFGDGTGSFQFAFSYSTGDGSYPIGVDINYLNNDSLLDIAVVNAFTNNVLIFFGNTDGSFVQGADLSTGDQSSPNSIQTIDLNNDKLIDILVANMDLNSVGVFYGLGDGKYEEQATSSIEIGSLPIGTAVGDFNQDNQLDIVTINWNGNGISILLGYPNKTFSSPTSFSTGQGSSPSAIKIRDMNNDEYLDIIVSLYGTSNVVVFYGLGDGTFLLGKLQSTGTNSAVWALDVGDFNSDSYFDIVVANMQTKNIGIFISDNFDPFGSLTTYSTGDGSQPHSVAIADCNNDHRMDIIVTKYGTNSIGIFLAAADVGRYNDMIDYSTGTDSAPYGVTTTDLNNDGNIDIIVANSGTNEILILLGHGNGSFADGLRYTTGSLSNPYSVAVSDFNNDTMIDISVANYGASNIFILYGLGDGNFINQTSYGFGYQYHPASVVVSDLNNDKLVDMVIAATGTDHVETMVKMC